MRVLLSAFYLSPYRGSEAGLGWKTAAELSKHCEVTVICGDVAPGGVTGADLEKLLASGMPSDGFRIEYVAPPPLAPFFNSLHAFPGLWFLYYTAYNLWQKAALAKAKELHAIHRFDLVHHVNVIGYREPGYLWKLGIPFFWGPIAGAPMIPWDFIRLMNPKGRFRWGSRNIANAWQMRINGRCRVAAEAASKVWTVTPEDHRMVTQIWGYPAEPMLETGADILPTVRPKNLGQKEALRLVWSGQFQPIKALPVLFEALSGLPPDQRDSWILEVLGDGEEKATWQKLAARLGIDHRIRWHGMLSKERALGIVGDAHILVHTSVKEGTPHAVLEALSRGLPVVCHDACGMGTAVTSSCGRKIPLVNLSTSVQGFKAALLEFLLNPGLVAELSTGAIARAHELSWENKIKRIWHAYQDIPHLQSNRTTRNSQ